MQRCTLLLLLAILSCTLLQAQKFMQLPDSAKGGLEMMDIKIRGGAGYMRYAFGPYHSENIRRGWKTSSTTRGVASSFVSRLFSRTEETLIRENSALAFISAEKDTAYVHISVDTKLQYTDYSRGLFGKSNKEKELEGGTSNFVSLIQYNKDTTEWSLTTFSTITESNIVKVASDQFKAWLTNGERRIALTPVYKYEDGKAHVSGEMLGCVFEEDGKVLGAIQFLGPVLISLQKQNYIWLQRNLDPNNKFVLATAAATLMARVHQLR